MITYISLSLTPVVFAVCYLVVRKYGKMLSDSLRPTKREHWLALGITIGFLCKLFDNLYWSFAWTSFAFGGPDIWFEWGQFSNIFFRQIALILSGYCHLRGIYAGHGEITKEDWISSIVSGLLTYAGVLVIVLCL